MVKSKIALWVVCVFLSICLASCYTNWMPQDGVWFCEELEMQISFTEDVCFAIIDGKTIPCACFNDIGSKWFFVISQATNINDLPVGTELFSAEYVELTDEKFIVREEKTGNMYTFINIANPVKQLD